MLLLLSRDSVEYGQGILLLMTLTFSLRIIKQEEAEFPKFLGIQLSWNILMLLHFSDFSVTHSCPHFMKSLQNVVPSFSLVLLLAIISINAMFHHFKLLLAYYFPVSCFVYSLLMPPFLYTQFHEMPLLGSPTASFKTKFKSPLTWDAFSSFFSQSKGLSLLGDLIISWRSLWQFLTYCLFLILPVNPWYHLLSPQHLTWIRHMGNTHLMH